MPNTPQIYQLKIRLKEIRPMIWRRLLIQETATLEDLHYAIQIIMGWTNWHLNDFVIRGKSYGIPNAIGNISFSGNVGSALQLKDFGFKKKENFVYKYDFTARWNFEIQLEEIKAVGSRKLYPVCVAGEGASPDEECGGPFHFEKLKKHWFSRFYEIESHLLDVLTDKRNADKILEDVLDMNEIREVFYWLNIDRYDLKKVNKFLRLYAKKDERWRDAFAEIIYF